MNISLEAGIGIIFTIVGTLIGSVAGAFGANLGLRERLDKTDARVDRVETRVGITDTGALTGNGLIGETRELRQVVEKHR